MKELRVSIAAIVVFLLCIGIIMIYSASGVYAQQVLGNPNHYLNRHLMFLSIGLMMMFGVMSFDYRKLREYAKPLLMITLSLLVLVLIPHIGKSSYGARRWFNFGPFNFQPSEFAKITIMIYVADFLARKQSRIHTFWEGFVPIMIVMGMVCLLVIKQPDFGNTLLIAAIILMMAFMAGARLIHLGSLIVLAMPVLVYLVIKAPYRMRRIVAFLDPWQDSQGAGFQLAQSQIAFGSGGLFGVGLGQSVQKLFYLPAAHTDFILSIIGEELGLVGAYIVIFLFAALIWQGARVAKRTTDPFGYYLAIGIISMIGLQAVVNIGVSIGAFPTKGLPLPFVSYGGSALIFNLIAIGLLMNISRVEDL